MLSDPFIIFGGALLAALAAGSTGFAYAIIAMAIWLHIMPPARAVPLVVVSSIVLNVGLIWHLRGDVAVRRLTPFLLGAVVGVPIGIYALRYLDPSIIRDLVAWVLVAYSVTMYAQREMPVLRLSAPIATKLDGAVGILGGFMGGATSLNGMFPTLWTGLRGWNKREQRGVIQPYILLVHLYTLLWLGGVGGIGKQTLHDVVLCLPALVLGAVVGLALFDRFSDDHFRRLILLLFLTSGILLLM